ncbi:hypothetical protein SBRCBS47491_001168 [Sporothrix bragantina]|uniref:cellulase n=1 Tax=Sporothrix bragantina TaxID=671064 RepID=A0ABP0AWD1_9PEZI
MLSLPFSALLAYLGLFATARAAVKFLGVAMAGGDFGCDIDGSCPLSTATLPLTELGHADGGGQMKHFVDDDGVNMFRLPTSWQFLINDDKEVSDTLDPTNAGRYDQFVQACLSTGAYCMIDVHNFARFNGGIVGQGGPSDDMFVAIWVALAKKYAKDSRVVFEITNEPHDLDTDLWAQTCQKVVTGIRNAGATTQMILLPGSNFDSAATITTSGGADALLEITNPDGSFDGLYLDIHKYLDNNNSGQNEECTTNNIGNFSIVADYLRQKKRQGLISETGSSDSSSCLTDFCAQNEYLNANDDVFIGYVGWAAGQFDSTYVLSLTPTLQSDGTYKDNQLFSQCVLEPYQKAGGALPTPPTSSTTRSTSTSTAMATKTQAQPSPSISTATDSGSNKGGLKGGSNTPSSSAASAPAPSSTNAAPSQAIRLVKNVIVAAVAGAALF